MAALRLAFLLTLAFLLALAASGRLRFLAAEFPSFWRRVGALLLLLVVLVVAVFYPVASLGQPAVDPGALWFPALFAGHGLLLAFLAAWWTLAGRPSLRAFLSVPRADVLAAANQGAAAGMFGWVLAILTLSILASAASLLPGGEGGPTEMPDMMIWLAELPLAHKLAIILAAMTVEEGFFRAFLQARIGLWLSSGLFALAHFSYGLPMMVLAVLTISLVIGRLFERTRNLLPCIAAHGMFDAIQLLIVLPLAVRFG